MIEAIISDLGRVTSAQKPASLFRDYERELALQPGVLNRVMFGSHAWHKVLIGQVSLEDYWHEIGPALGLRTPEEIETFRHRYFADETVNLGHIEAARSLGLHGMHFARARALDSELTGLLRRETQVDDA